MKKFLAIILLSLCMSIPVFAAQKNSKQEELDRKNEQARMVTIQTLGRLTNLINQYYMQNNQLPANINIFNGGYGAGPIVDGWGHPIVYQNNGFSFKVISLGADGKRNSEFGAGSGFYDMDIVYP